jgi:16S rRNA U516 pseudouridylate synthase RsuA-like enzyme
MCSGVGYKVQRLIRVQLGTITIKDLKPGQVRVLTPKDLITLL